MDISELKKSMKKQGITQNKLVILQSKKGRAFRSPFYCFNVI